MAATGKVSNLLLLSASVILFTLATGDFGYSSALGHSSSTIFSDDFKDAGDILGEDGPPDREGVPDDEGPPSGSNPDDSDALCDNSGASADYTELLSGDGDKMVRHSMSETSCPNHVNWNINPNPAKVFTTNTSIPAFPMLMKSGETTDLSSTPGAIGILRNGADLGSAWAVSDAVSYETSAFYIEASTFDPCGGHATIDGWYHYHSTPGCLQEQAVQADGKSPYEHSPQLGWAFDGFPVYGQLGADGIEMKVCGQDGADSRYCLDLCSGFEGELPGEDDFKYRYYTSCGFDESFYPFTANCYRGCCPEGMECAKHVEACTGDAEKGYTAQYTPVASSSLADPYDATLIEGVDADLINSTSNLDCSLYMGSWDLPTPATAPVPSTDLAVMVTTPAPSPPPTSGRAVAPFPTASPSTITPTPSPTIPPIFLESPAPTAWTGILWPTPEGGPPETARRNTPGATVPRPLTGAPPPGTVHDNTKHGSRRATREQASARSPWR